MPIYSSSEIIVGKVYTALTSNTGNSVSSDWTIDTAGTNGVIQLSSALDLGDSVGADTITTSNYVVVLCDGSAKFNNSIPADTPVTISFWSTDRDCFTGYDASETGDDLFLEDSANGSSSWGSVTGARFKKTPSSYPGSSGAVYTSLAGSSVVDHAEILDELDCEYFEVTFIPSSVMYYRLRGGGDSNGDATKLMHDLKITIGHGIQAANSDLNIHPLGRGLDTKEIRIDGTKVSASATELNYTDVAIAGTTEASKAVITDSSNNVRPSEEGGVVQSWGVRVNTDSDGSTDNSGKWIKILTTDTTSGFGLVAAYSGSGYRYTTVHSQVLVNLVGKEQTAAESGNFTLLLNVKYTPDGSSPHGSPYYSSHGTSLKCVIIGDETSDLAFDPATDLRMRISTTTSTNLYAYVNVFIKTPGAYKDVVVTQLSGGKADTGSYPASSARFETVTGQSWVVTPPDGQGTHRWNIGGTWEGLRVGTIKAETQPAFLVRTTGGTANNLSTATIHTVKYDDEAFDIGSNFNTTTYTFTAPKTGIYCFNASVYLTNIDTASDYYKIDLITNNDTYRLDVLDPNFSSDVGFYSMGGSIIANMSASHTAYVIVYQHSGTAQTDVSATGYGTYFSGYLLG
jgi:hypothetical protein